MTDGTGSTSYSYNQLSQLISETRQFSGLSGTYSLTYAYNLSGALTSITDPFSAAVGYTYDQVGRVSAVTGAGFANVSSYASNLSYRAWGAIKQMSYGNGLSMSMGYDARLRATSYAVPGIISKSYDYDADSRLHLSHDSNPKFDRSYTYDHAGRLTQALSGAEARNEGTTNLRPYKQTFKYDAFNHLVERPINQVWSGTGGAFSPAVQSYQNNKNTAWQYDAAGNLTDSGDVEYTIAAGGEAARVISDIYLGYNPQSSVWGVTTDLTQSYDGERAAVKKVEATTTHDNELGDETTTSTTYLLRSSVLGGKVVTEIDELGRKQRGFVYLGGSVLAWQMRDPGATDSVKWEHRDASDASFRMSNQNAVVDTSTRKELDALGTDAGVTDPNPATQGWQKMSSYPGFGSSFASSDTQCTLNFMMTPCSTVFHFMGAGAAKRCPNDDCGPRSVTVKIIHDSGREETHTGLVTDPFFNADVRYTGAAAGAAAEQFHLGMAKGGGGFEEALLWTLMAGDMMNGRPIGDHFAPQNSIEIIDTGGDTAFEKNKDIILALISRMSDPNGSCAAAFKRAGLPTPGDIVNKGLILGSRRALTDAAYNEVLGLTDDLREKYNKKAVRGNALTVWGSRGKPIILFSGTTFTDNQYLEDVPHEFIHAAGIKEWRFIIGHESPLSRGHDLSHFPPYQDIINNCK